MKLKNNEYFDLTTGTKFYVIPEFPNYMISKFGLIYDLNNKRILPEKRKYKLIDISGEEREMTVERLMCNTFYAPSNIPYINNFPESIDATKIKLCIDRSDIVYESDDIINIYGMRFKRVYDTCYYISTNGICYNFDQNLFVKSSISNGYYHLALIARLCKISTTVHRIVYQVWNDNILDDEIEIDHLNGHSWDNDITNLDPVTSIENIYRASLGKYLKDGQTPKDFIEQVASRICERVPYKEISKEFGLPVHTIKHIATKKSYKMYTTQFDFTHCRGLITKDEAEKMRDLINQNYSSEYISKFMNIDIHVVRKFRNGKIMKKYRDTAKPIMDGKCVLTEKEIIQIKKLLTDTDLSDTYIGKLYGVSRRAINSIRHNKVKSYNRILEANGLLQPETA